MTHHSVDEWRKCLGQVERGAVDGVVDARVLRNALQDLISMAAELDVWKASARHWETETTEVRQALESAQAEHRAVQSNLESQIESLEAIVKLMRGKADPMRDILVRELRSEVLAATPQRVDYLARETYRQIMLHYGLKDSWETESSERRRGFGETMETVLKILAEDLVTRVRD